MEILGAIAGKITEFMVEPITRPVNYIIDYKSNLQNLQTQVDNLSGARDRVHQQVVEAENKGKKIYIDVQNWLERVSEVIEKATEILKNEGQVTEIANQILQDGHQKKMKCLHGCRPNLMLHYQLSKKSRKLVPLVVELYGKRDFSSVAYSVPKQEVCSISRGDYKEFDSRISTLKKIMEELSNSSSTDMILVWGVSGVGKTTLMEEVVRISIMDKLFDDVVMVRDVKDPDLGKIQKEIVTKLGLDIFEHQTVSEIAPILGDRIKGKKTLVILDDVWEEIDFIVMGLPRLVNCKILLTSRIRKVLSIDMRPQKDFSLDILDEKESWVLFEKIVGDVVKVDQGIRKVANQVAKKCGGLPVLVVTVASALKNRTNVSHWRDALRRIDGFDKELTRKTYLALEWSYNQLDEEDLKPLFMLCALTPTKNRVHMRDLLKYGMGLGLFNNVKTVEAARDALHSLVEKLKDSCLLLNNDYNPFVRMHDLVHDVAISIARREEHVLQAAYGDELKEWPNIDFFRKCTAMSLAYCNIPKLPAEVLHCPELKFLLISNINDLEIPCNFFQEMRELKVLDFTSMVLNRQSLPPSLQDLKNLHTLSLDYCELEDISLVGQLQNLEILSFSGSRFKLLPKEIGQLTRLRLLDLSKCNHLEVISPDVISSLTMLEELTMINNFNQWEGERVLMGERRNASLSELKHLSHLTALEICIPDANSLPAHLFSNICLERFHISIGVVLAFEVRLKSTLNAVLNLKLPISNELDRGLKMLLERSEALCLDRSIEYHDIQGYLHHKHSIHIINSKVQLSNLTSLEVYLCDGTSLFSSSTARSLIQLKHLEISRCPFLVDIVSTQECSEETEIIIFRKLEHIELRDLPNLARFCSGNYIEFPSLDKLELERRSTKLRALISDGVRFPRLKSLFLSDLPKLMTIWHNRQFSPDLDLQNLNSVKVQNCDSLRNIFPASMVGGLAQLQKLEVRHCGVVEEIVAGKEEGVENTTPPPPLEFVFPNVTSMTFQDLPQFRSFYPGMHVCKWSILNELIVDKCGKTEIFSVHPIKPSLFLIDKNSFPKLESLTLGSYGGLPTTELVSKLKIIRLRGGASFFKQAALVFLENLHNLETIELICDFDERISSSRSSKSSSSSSTQLPRVRHLKLQFNYSMDNLMMHLGAVFPSLEVLEVLSCHNLKNIESSAISFQNLTTLKVISCDKMGYLTNCSVAKSLMQLTTLEVRDCPSLYEIFGDDNNADDDAQGNCYEIVFIRLQNLTLQDLPSLQRFFSRTCVVKFPSLQNKDVSYDLKWKIFRNDHDDEISFDSNEDSDQEWKKQDMMSGQYGCPPLRVYDNWALPCLPSDPKKKEYEV